jgi:dTDP-glucose 4,6-dehydratase
VFGERQNPEAFIPATIGKILRGEQIKIHANAAGQSGARYYIYAEDVASAVLFLLGEKANRDKFNISGSQEVSNLCVAQLIARSLEKSLDYILVHNDRPGCDFRYGLNGSTLRGMGWETTRIFGHALLNTVNWYKENPQWLTKRTAAVFK